MPHANGRANGADEALLNGYPLRVAEPAEGVALLKRAQATVEEAELKALLESWEPCVPVRSEAVPSFPLDVFAPWARDYLKAVCESLRVPTDFAGMWFLGLLGLTHQKLWRVRVKPDWTESLSLWVIVAAPSGTRKSPTFKMVFGPVTTWQERFAKIYKPIRDRAERDIKTLAAEVARLREKKPGTPILREKEEALENLTVPPTPKLYSSSITPERLETVLKEQMGRFGLASAESKILAIMMGEYRSSGPPPIEAFLSAWNDEDLDAEYQGRGSVYVKGPHLSMALGTQPSNLNDLYSERKLASRGALARFLAAAPECSVVNEWDTTPVDPKLEQVYFGNCLRMLPSEGLMATAFEAGEFEPKTLELSPGAIAVFKPFFEGVKVDLSFNDEWSSKLCGQVARIAALLHLSDHADKECPRKIGADPFERAIFLAQTYLIPMARKVFTQSSKASRLQKLWEALLSLWGEAEKQSKKPEIKRSQLGQHFGFSGDEIEAGLAVLEEHHFLRVEKRRTGTRGPQSQIIILRPNPPRDVSEVSRVSANGLKPRPVAQSAKSGVSGEFSGVSQMEDWEDRKALEAARIDEDAIGEFGRAWE